MKVKLKLNSNIEKEKLNIVLKFMKYLNSEYQLNKDITVELTDIKDDKMTTGVRRKNGFIKILCKERMLVDILRTVGHEWIHEYQHQKGGASETKKYPEIGGWAEDEANSLSGSLLKKFSKEHKEWEDILY